MHTSIRNTYLLLGLLLFPFGSFLRAQVARDSASFQSRIILGKLTGPFFAREFRPDQYGRVLYCFAKNAFLERSELKTSRAAYKRSGFMARKLERYCKENKIELNLPELKHYRRQVVLSGFLYGVAAAHPVLFVLDAWDYSTHTGYYKSPQVFFKSKRAPYLWSAYVLEWFGALVIKNRADKRLRDRVFKTEVYTRR